MNINRLYRTGIYTGFIVLLMPLALFSGETQAKGIKTFASAINKAGRQRMLTQRIVKAYIMVGLDVQPDTANEQLLTAIELFEKQLFELKQFSKDGGTQKSLARVESLWEPFKNIALGKVSKKGVQELVKRDEALLKAAHQVVLKLQKTANSKLARLVNISGRQRMLSQRIAKFYMLAAWGVNSEASVKLMQTAIDEFNAALNELSSSKMNTPKIKESLEETRVQWSIFERSFRLRKGRYIPLLISMSSEKILVKMNEVTGLYDKLGK